MMHHLKSCTQATLLLAVCLFGLPLAMAAQTLSAGPKTGPVVVLTLPWSDPTAAIVAAGGRIVGPTRAPFSVFAAPDAPRFEQRLADAGYWTLRSKTLSALFCGVPQT